MSACYVCGGYIYGRARHADCPPKYRRQRIFSCERCGEMAAGRRHKKCGTVPAGWQKCGYCGDPTRGEFHNACVPDTYRYAVFADMAEVVQRQCTGCSEWYPFAAIGDAVVNTSEWWSPRGKAASGRPVYGKCRACIANTRRRRELTRNGVYHGPEPALSDADVARAAAMRAAGVRVVTIAAEFGVNRRTIYRALAA